MSILQLASTAEAFGRRGQPVGVSIAEVAVSGAAIVFGISMMIYRTIHGTPPRLRQKPPGESSDE